MPDRPINRLIVSIGLHKTGSTSIQASLQGYDRGGIRYADLGHRNHSTPLLQVLRPGYVRSEQRRDPSLAARGRVAAEKARADLARELATPAKTLILVAEGLSLCSREEVERFRDMVRSRACSVEIVACVREPLGLMSSIAQQQLKRWRPRPAPLGVNYQARLEPWLEVFGSVTFRLFDRSALVGGSVVQDFLQVAGIDPATVEERGMNQSMSLDAARWLACLWRSYPNIEEPRFRVARREAMALLTAMPGDKFRLPPDLVRAAVDKADVSWAENVTGFHLFEDGPDVEPSGYHDLSAFLADIDAAAMDRMRAFLAERGMEVAGTTPDRIVAEMFDSIAAAGPTRAMQVLTSRLPAWLVETLRRRAWVRAMLGR